jgi:hypothetical protein
LITTPLKEAIMNIAGQTPFIAPPLTLSGATCARVRALVQRAFGVQRRAAGAESRVSLDKGRTTWVAKPAGHLVCCESGTLWLTFDGELQDIVLEPGQTHRCIQGSALAIHALAPGVVRLA